MNQFFGKNIAGLLITWLLVSGSGGCGNTIKRSATDQLLMSNAIDLMVTQLDFRPLAGKKVFLDTQYLKLPTPKPGDLMSTPYIISSLRQQMVAAGVLLYDTAADAEYVVEARVGALGTDAHEMSYGIPASNGLTTVTSIMPGAPPVPTIPEISFAKKNDSKAVAKVILFAYNSKTREPVWQSGVTQGMSNAKDTWVLGAGPFQRGTIYKGTRLAGGKFSLPKKSKRDNPFDRDLINYNDQHLFAKIAPDPKPTGVQRATHEEASEKEKDPAKASDEKK